MKFSEVKPYEKRWVAPVVMDTLRRMASGHRVSKIANEVLSDPRFAIWGGSSGEGAHHNYHGGLAEHTMEVAQLADANARLLRVDVNHQELFLAALFHDVGKMWDYEYNEVSGKWQGTKHKRIIHHISRSGVEWVKAVEKTNSFRESSDNVLHAILAHHGRREWGSPVAPLSRVAWLVHLADQLSARMNDADTNDIIKAGNGDK